MHVALYLFFYAQHSSLSISLSFSEWCQKYHFFPLFFCISCLIPLSHSFVVVPLPLYSSLSLFFNYLLFFHWVFLTLSVVACLRPYARSLWSSFAILLRFSFSFLSFFLFVLSAKSDAIFPCVVFWRVFVAGFDLLMLPFLFLFSFPFRTSSFLVYPSTFRYCIGLIAFLCRRAEKRQTWVEKDRCTEGERKERSIKYDCVCLRVSAKNAQVLECTVFFFSSLMIVFNWTK